ncbi:hypothetical protein [Litorimonas sp. WD9-15]|uniref:hypothetical protein n=1 Tax=Litorimonas sp. WD9-15 TaxID=3418716 RepID=UPI003CFE2B04
MGLPFTQEGTLAARRGVCRSVQFGEDGPPAWPAPLPEYREFYFILQRLGHAATVVDITVRAIRVREMHRVPQSRLQQLCRALILQAPFKARRSTLAMKDPAQIDLDSQLLSPAVL